MNRSMWWLAPVALILLVAGIVIGAAVADRHDDDRTVRVVTTTNSTGEPGQVIAIDRDGRWGHGGGFFPFGFLLFPLIWIAVIFLVFRAFRGGWGGPGGGNGRMDDWHRRQHESPPTPPTGTVTT